MDPTGTEAKLMLLMWSEKGIDIDGKITPKQVVSKGVAPQQQTRSPGATRGPEDVQAPEVECKEPDMKAATAMEGVSVGDFVYYMLHCLDWFFTDVKTGQQEVLQMLPDKESKHGVLTWVQKQTGENFVYPSTNDLRMMPGLFSNKGINGDNFQLSYRRKTELGGADAQLATLVEAKKPYYNYAIITTASYQKMLPVLGQIFENNTNDTFFYNSTRDTLKIFTGSDKELLETKDWDYDTSPLLSTVELKVKANKSAEVGKNGEVNVQVKISQEVLKGASGGVVEYETCVDRVPLLSSSVIALPICLNEDSVNQYVLKQGDDCYLCMAKTALKLKEGDEVYSECGHTSLCEDCIVTWNDAQHGKGTCPECRKKWKPGVIAKNVANWRVKRKALDAPVLTKNQVMAKERLAKRAALHRLHCVNVQSKNMFICATRKWDIIFEVKEHDGKDDDAGALVDESKIQRVGNVLTYQVNEGQLVKVKIQNTSNENLRFVPVYITEAGDSEPENSVDLKPGEDYELPYPLQKDAGEDPDDWQLHDSDGQTVLTLRFCVQ